MVTHNLFYLESLSKYLALNDVLISLSQVEITLQDVNDNPPIFPTDTLDVTIQENISDGFRIMQLTATDADEVKIPSGTDALAGQSFLLHSQ